MSNIKFYHVRYRNIKLILGISNYNFNYYVQRIRGGIMLIVNENLGSKEKNKLLHKIIKRTGKK